MSETTGEITDLNQLIKRGRIRATANKVLTPEIAAKIGAAQGTFLGGKGILVIGREFNNNNRMLKRAYIGGVMSAGVDILNLHSAPVPVLQFCIRRFGASGGVYFSSGSSLEGETTIRFFDAGGVEYTQKNIESINEYFKTNKIRRADPLEVGSISDIPHTHDIYRKAIIQFVDRKLLASKNLRVVMDCSYGPSGIVSPGVLTDLKVDIIALNSYESDRKSNQIFPNLQSIKTCVNIVKASGADLGVVLDGDGSRSVFIDETGTVVSYEELMMMFIQYEESIKKQKGNPIISSEYASKVLDDFAQNKGYKLIKSSNFPGEISRLLREERACFGGSDTFKYYFPAFGPFSDATFTAIKILEIMASQNVPLSALVRAFPRTVHSYKTIPIPKDKISSVQYDLKKKFRTITDPNVDYQDILIGLKVTVKEKGFITIIPSILSDTVDLTAEGKSSQNAEELIALAEKFVRESFV